MRRRNRKRKGLKIISGLLLLGAIFAFVFPYLSEFLYQLQVDQMVNEFDEGMENPDEFYQSAMKYNEGLQNQDSLADPFSNEQSGFDFGEGIFGYITIPKMDITLPVYLGATEGNLRKGAAHLSETSLPVGGVSTNAVIAAHRGAGTKAMFRNIEWLEDGDKVYIKNYQETLLYKVVETAVIVPTEIEKLQIQEGRDLVTLITCHPYRQSYQRYLVYCERVLE